MSSMLNWCLIHFLEHGLKHNREKRPAQWSFKGDPIEGRRTDLFHVPEKDCQNELCFSCRCPFANRRLGQYHSFLHVLVVSDRTQEAEVG